MEGRSISRNGIDRFKNDDFMNEIKYIGSDSNLVFAMILPIEGKEMTTEEVRAMVTQKDYIQPDQKQISFSFIKFSNEDLMSFFGISLDEPHTFFALRVFKRDPIDPEKYEEMIYPDSDDTVTVRIIFQRSIDLN